MDPRGTIRDILMRQEWSVERQNTTGQHQDDNFRHLTDNQPKQCGTAMYIDPELLSLGNPMTKERKQRYWLYSL